MLFYEVYSDHRREFVYSDTPIEDWAGKVATTIAAMPVERLKPQDGSDWFTNVIKALVTELGVQRIATNAEMIDVEWLRRDKLKHL